jgi:hypothetical protein
MALKCKRSHCNEHSKEPQDSSQIPTLLSKHCSYLEHCVIWCKSNVRKAFREGFDVKAGS